MTPLLDGSVVGLLLTGAVLAAVLGVLLIGVGVRIPAWATPRPIPLAGILLVAPLLLVRSLSTIEYLGLAALLVGGVAVPTRFGPLAHGTASIPGAVLLALGLSGPGRGLILVLVPVLTAAVSRFEEGHDYEPGLAAICAAITGGGAFLTVPDTENMALLAGAGVAVGLLVLGSPRLSLAQTRSLWLGVFVWAVAVDGVGRATGIIGALGALGLLMIDPVVRTNLDVNRGLLTYLPTKGVRLQVLLVATIQTALALFAARIAGLQTDPAIAIVLVAVSSTVTGYLLARRAERMP